MSERREVVANLRKLCIFREKSVAKNSEMGGGGEGLKVCLKFFSPEIHPNAQILHFSWKQISKQVNDLFPNTLLNKQFRLFKILIMNLNVPFD